MSTREIDRRARALTDAAEGGAVEPWMTWMIAYHATMRAALFVKARVARAPMLSDDVARCVVQNRDRSFRSSDRRGFRPCGGAPPRGRLNAFVFERLG